MPESFALTIAADLRDRFPGLACGGFVALDIPLTGSPPAPAYEMIRQSLESEGITLDEIASEPRIAAWRSAIQSSGVKASKFRGSAEQLARRVLRGGGVDAPPLIDLYCRISARYLAPLGGYDVDRLPGTRIELRHARVGRDSFQPLGAEAGDMPITGTIPVYAAEDVVLCWLFNVRDSAITALTPATRRALFLSEALTPLQARASIDALTALRRALLEWGARAGEICWSAENDLTISFA